MSEFSFTILKKSNKSKARLGILKTPHGEVQTPAFVTVGTKGTVKSLTPDELQMVGTQMVFVNTYHSVISPGVDLIEKAGGIHAFSHIEKPIITDSGGFQVFSLSRRNPRKGGPADKSAHLVKITDEGVEFRSPIDGELFFFTPEFVIDAQKRIGADLIVAFDECVPYQSGYAYTKKSLHRTHEWAVRSCTEFKRHDCGVQKLYGVIQGGVYEDLRKISTKYITSLPFFGLAIGGVSVGEDKREMREQVGWVMDMIGDDPRPKHLLGIGEIDDIFDTIAMGIDTMDCVIPTRHARVGKLYVQSMVSTKAIELDMTKGVYKNDLSPVDIHCSCDTCHHFTRAYLHHLFKQRELLGYRLATIHNLHFMERLFRLIRKSIH